MSNPIRSENFTNNLFYLLQETFESPPNPSSAYLDQKTGLFETLDGVTAEEASRPVAAGGTTIAAQTAHSKFYLEVLERFMQGNTERADWRESWRLQEVSPEAWDVLRAGLRETYTRILDRLKGLESWGDDEIGDGMAILVHSAYHLGAIRQMLRVIR